MSIVGRESASVDEFHDPKIGQLVILLVRTFEGALHDPFRSITFEPYVDGFRNPLRDLNFLPGVNETREPPIIQVLDFDLYKISCIYRKSLDGVCVRAISGIPPIECVMVFGDGSVLFQGHTLLNARL